MHNRHRRKKMLSEINVVPYIDVMLVLLVIFMITAPLLNQGVTVNLPKLAAKTVKAPPRPPIVVTVNQRGKYFLNISQHPEQPISMQNLRLRITTALRDSKEKNQDQAIYVKGDTDANYGVVARAMVALQQAGAHSVGLVTEES